MTRRTSAAAYRRLVIEGALPRKRAAAYAVLYHVGPATTGRILQEARRIRDRLAGLALAGDPLANLGWPVAEVAKMSRNDLASRISECRRQGVVDEVGEEADPRTGHRSILWDVSDRQLARPLEAAPRDRVLLRFSDVDAARVQTLLARTGLYPDDVATAARVMAEVLPSAASAFRQLAEALADHARQVRSEGRLF